VYTLASRLPDNGEYYISVIGCGGTGSFVAEGLCRILPERARLVLIDFDRVEERNLIRQNFTEDDLGKVKSEALALRLAHKYRRAIAYSTVPVHMTEFKRGLVIGCVDNGLARQDIARKYKPDPYGGFHHWWVDAGNGENYGQILIGNYDVAAFRENKFVALPLPTMQQPALLNQIPPVLDCAQIAEQGPTINQGMAFLVVEVVRRLIDESCPWMQLYLDIENGTLRPVFATPEAARETFGKRKVKEIKDDTRNR
jgi:hypothetical protein